MKMVIEILLHTLPTTRKISTNNKPGTKKQDGEPSCFYKN